MNALFSRQRPLADGCRYVFLDCGANIGVHDRFLFEPERYPKSEYSRIVFKGTFPAVRKRTDVCSFAFEPNPRHSTYLNQLQDAYRRKGWRLTTFSAAVGAQDGTERFSHSERPQDLQNNEWKFGSAAFWHKTYSHVWPNATNHTVPTMDLAAFLNQHVHPRMIPSARLPTDPPPAVVMKMDVEGSEYATLAAMLVKGQLCQVSKISMEWHDFMCSGPLCAVSARFEELTRFVRSTPGCANLTLVMFDDESYRLSRFPFP